MSPESSERREYFRFDLANVVELVTADAATSEQHRGVTIDVSETGMSLFVFQPIRMNDRVSIVKSMLPLCHRAGRVRWVNRLATDFYKIGLMFDPEEGSAEESSPVDSRTGKSLHSPAHKSHAKEV